MKVESILRTKTFAERAVELLQEEPKLTITMIGYLPTCIRMRVSYENCVTDKFIPYEVFLHKSSNYDNIMIQNLENMIEEVEDKATRLRYDKEEDDGT